MHAHLTPASWSAVCLLSWSPCANRTRAAVVLVVSVNAVSLGPLSLVPRSRRGPGCTVSTGTVFAARRGCSCCVLAALGADTAYSVPQSQRGLGCWPAILSGRLAVLAGSQPAPVCLAACHMQDAVLTGSRPHLSVLAACHVLAGSQPASVCPGRLPRAR